MKFVYTVRCQFESDEHVEAWINWLKNRHIADVIEAGAVSARLCKMDDLLPTFEVRYDFATRSSFEEYEKCHADRLRAEGLELFHPSKGITYSRTMGEVLLSS